MDEKLDIMKVGIFGAITGVATTYLLKYIVMPVLGMISGFVPAISAKLADPGTINIAVRDSMTGINGGLSAWLADAMNLTVNIPYQTIIMSAAGGALFFIAGAYIASKFGLLKGSATQKTTWVIFLGSAVTALVLSGFKVPSIDLALVDILIAFGINAAILSWLYVTVDKTGNLGLVPF